MNEKKISLWKNPPYADHSSDHFCASITEYRANSGNTCIVVCPGGGYSHKAYHEGEPIALMLNEHGINAFVLDYSIAPCHKFAPLSDAQRAIRTARSLGYEKVGILGFSAGGHLTCSAATLYAYEAYAPTDEIDLLCARPDVFIPCYPVVSMNESFAHIGSRKMLLGDEWESEELVKLFSCELNVNENTPPAFIWHTASDTVVPVRNSFELATALSKNKVPFELHIYPDGPHGLGLANDREDVRTWSDNLAIFLAKLGYTK